jgi:hypothetical protein
MRLIEPAELSAYLDGELDPGRAREVATALANDPKLRAEYEVLANSDKYWKSSAAAARFKPAVVFSSAQVFGTAPLYVVAVAALIALCVSAKATDAVFLVLILHCIALTITLPWVMRMAREDQNPSHQNQL